MGIGWKIIIAVLVVGWIVGIWEMITTKNDIYPDDWEN